MATLSADSDKQKDENDELTQRLNEIITQNLSIGISKLGNDDTDDLNDDHVDIKSNTSTKWRRGSVSYSQPSSPKGNRSLSPVSSVSSLSELSTEYPDDGDSESCASLNSVNSTMSNDSSFHNGMLHGIMSKELIIDENEANIDPVPIDDDNNHNQNKKNNENITYNKNNNNENHNKNKKNNNVNKNKSKSNNRMNNKLNIPINKKQHKQRKKRKHGLTKSMSYDNARKLSSKHSKPKKSASASKIQQRRNSKDCLDITAISRLTTKPIYSWSVSEVIEWVKLIDHGKYKEYTDKFKQKKIDGKKLYKLNRSMLQSIEIYHPSARKAILAALQKLKTKIRQNSKKQINFYAKKHGYDKKKKHQKKHRRGISTPNGANMQKLTLSNGEKYVVAIKKQNVDQLSIMPAMTPSISAPLRKKSLDISEFLHEWDIKQSHDSNINFLNSTILEQTDNFTMIELENKRIVYAVTAKVEKWDNNDVCKWLNSISSSRFKRFIPKFKQRNTNGFDLLNISRVQLQNNIGMIDGTMRNTLLREIKLLKFATQPNRKQLLKKRSSAISVNDIQKASKKAGHGHRRSASSITGCMSSSSLSRLNRVENIGFIPRKLGPRDIGRSDYKGTKYERDLFNFDFMEEKINYHSKTAQFNKRKELNPVKHKETVDEIGICADFTKPRYTNDILQSINRMEWLKDKPISRRNAYLDSLKGDKISRNDLVSDIMQKPVGWTPIEYIFKNDGKEFLEEHFWFDASAIQFEFGFSRLLNCLPPQKLLKLNKEPAPTGYESKLNWLRMLSSMVNDEMILIQKEDDLYNNNNNNNDHFQFEEKKEDDAMIKNVIVKEDNMVPILAEPPIIYKMMKEEEEEKEKEKEKEVEPVDIAKTLDFDNVLKGDMQRKSINMEDVDGDGNGDNDGECVDVNKFRRRRNMDKVKMNMDAIRNSVNNEDIMDGESDSSSNVSEEVLSSPSGSNLSSPDMKTKRANYKMTRNRANTTLANSRLGGIGGSNASPMAPMTPRTRKRVLSRQDINRRRFMSQESIDSIQAMITNIEKKRSNTNNNLLQ